MRLKIHSAFLNLSRHSDWPLPNRMNHKERTNLLEKALELHKVNSHDDAEKLYSRVREACPRDFDAWFLSGAMAFQRGGHLEQAIELLKTARKLNPSSIECRMFLGMALADLGRHSEATPHLEITVKKFPHQTEVWKNLAKCKHSTGNLSGAREALEKLAQLRGLADCLPTVHYWFPNLANWVHDDSQIFG
jgi:predicted Zn-dependent protease